MALRATVSEETPFEPGASERCASATKPTPRTDPKETTDALTPGPCRSCYCTPATSSSSTAAPSPPATNGEEKNSVAIASNESFSGWTKTFTDPRLCAAIVDRPTFGGHIIETDTDSYRLARTAHAIAAAG
jgi:hypothetical protein